MTTVTSFSPPLIHVPRVPPSLSERLPSRMSYSVLIFFSGRRGARSPLELELVYTGDSFGSRVRPATD